MIESMHERVVQNLQAVKGRWPTVARESGVSLRTIEKVARRESKNPRVNIIEQLDRYFGEQETERRVAS